MDFYSISNRPKTIDHPETEKELPIYLEKVDKHGHSYLEQTGVQPIYENIQKFKDDVDTYKVLKRYECGDPNVVARLDKTIPGGVLDVTNMPTNLIDLKNMLKQADVLFDCLTPTERSNYNNNINEFLADLSAGNVPDSLKGKHVVKEREQEQAAPVEQAVADNVEGVKYE